MPDDPVEPKDPGQDQLLQGEPSRSRDLGDVRHWTEVYRELLGAKRRLLEEIGEQRTGLEPPARVELDNDRKLIEREADRLSRRLSYWERELRKGGRS